MSGTGRGARRRKEHGPHLGVHQPGQACTWCGYLDARGVWWLIALTCLPQLVGRWSPPRWARAGSAPAGAGGAASAC